MQLNPTKDAHRLPCTPQPVECTSEASRRVDDWLLLRKVPLHKELAEVAAGRRGELGVRSRLDRHEATRFGAIYGGKRVPRDALNRRAGRYEIDLILITPKCVRAIEVKNWSGRLSVHGDQWVHERRGGEVVVHPNLLDHQQAKLHALRSYLESRHVFVPPERYEFDLVFDNPSLKLEGSIAASPRVMSTGAWLRGQALPGPASPTGYALAGVIEYFARADDARKLADGMFNILPPGLVREARAAVSDLRTWDRITLHGGRCLIGDLLWIQLGDERVAAERWASGLTIKTCWRRNLLPSLFPLMGYGPFGSLKSQAFTSRPIGVYDCLYFHEAGQQRPSIIALRDIDLIQVG